MFISRLLTVPYGVDSGGQHSAVMIVCVRNPRIHSGKNLNRLFSLLLLLRVCDSFAQAASWFVFSRLGGALLWCLPRRYSCQEWCLWERNKDETAPVTGAKSAGSYWMFAITNTFHAPFLRTLARSCSRQCAALTRLHFCFACKEYLCDVQLSAHTCFPSGQPR